MEPQQHGVRRGWRYKLWVACAFLGALALIWRVGFAIQHALGGMNVNGGVGRISGHTELRHAKGFTIEYRSDCKILRVSRPWPTASRGLTYVLVPRGHRPAVVEPGAVVIETPIRRAISLSTVHAATFLRLGCPEVLVGMAGVRLLNTPELQAQARRGALVEVSDGGLSMTKKLDMERIRLLAPDLILTSGNGDPAMDFNGKLMEAGFKVVFNTEWLEATPLGRAEWIKFAAAFLDREPEAERLFKEVEANYERQANRVRNVVNRPTVFSGMDYRGTWHMPGGQSYVACFIRDAGGDYLWKDDTSTGSVPLKVEAVLDRASQAQAWVVHMSSSRSLRQLKETDDRVALFRAFREGRVYTNDLKVNASGGNDYWENGTVRPDLVLSDLIALLHPELAEGHTYHWYRKLPAETQP